MLLEHLRHQRHERQEVVAELERGKAVVTNLIEKVRKDESVELKRYQRRLNSLLTYTSMRDDELWDIYGELNKIIERAKDLEASKLWNLQP